MPATYLAIARKGREKACSERSNISSRPATTFSRRLWGPVWSKPFPSSHTSKTSSSSLTHERGGNHAQADSSEYGLGSALDAELGQNMTHMEFDGLLEEMQVAGNLFIGVPL